MIYFIILAIGAVIAIMEMAQSLGTINWKPFLLKLLFGSKPTPTPTPTPNTGPTGQTTSGQTTGQTTGQGTKPITTPVSKREQPTKHISRYYRVLNSGVPVYTQSFKPNVTEKECQKYCDQRPGCMAYDYIPSKKYCNMNKQIKKSGTTTGMRRINGSYKRYNDTSLTTTRIIPPFATKKQSDCGTQCNRHKNCHWYTYTGNQCSLYKADYDPTTIHAQKP